MIETSTQREKRSYRVSSPDPAPPSRGLVRSEFRLVAVLSIVVGALLLLENLGVVGGVHRLWPVFPALVGAGLLLLFRERRRHEPLLVGAGSYLVGVSILFFVCNFVSWGILAHAWPVFVAILGVSSILASIFARRTRGVLWSSGVLLVLVAVVLLLVIEVDPGLWPISLVLFGLWVLLLSWVRHRVESVESLEGVERAEREGEP